MVRLIPRDSEFLSDMIADGENLLAAARALEAMAHEYDRLEERVAEIRELEHAGDVLDAQIQTRIEDSFVLPFDRSDAHELVVRLDDVVDGIQQTAETFLIYDIEAPTEEARRMTAILAAQASKLVEAIRRLNALTTIGPFVAEVHQLENEADGLSRAAIARLFRERTDPIEVIKLIHLYEGLEESIDAAEDAAEVLERIATKNA